MSNYEPEENESGEYEIDFKWDDAMAGATATPSPAEPEENESGEREFHDAWASVMAGAAGPRPAEPVAVDAARDKGDVAGVTVTCKTGTKPTPRERWLGAFGPVEKSRRGPLDWYSPQRPPLANPEDAARMDAPPSPVVNPAHYDVLGLMPWEAFDRGWLTKPEFIGHLRGSALEYVARAPHKNGAEDYRKAIRCLEKLLSLLAES